MEMLRLSDLRIPRDQNRKNSPAGEVAACFAAVPQRSFLLPRDEMEKFQNVPVIAGGERF